MAMTSGRVNVDAALTILSENDIELMRYVEDICYELEALRRRVVQLEGGGMAVAVERRDQGDDVVLRTYVRGGVSAV